jgi:hypothetical protein
VTITNEQRDAVRAVMASLQKDLEAMQPAAV